MNQTSSHILDFIRHLLSAIANATLYGAQHPQVVRLTSHAYETLSRVFQQQADFSLAIIESELIIDGHPQGFSLFLDRFIQTCGARGIGHIKVIQGITQQEITDFILEMSGHGAEAKTTVNSSEHIQLGQIDLIQSPGNGSAGQKSDSAGGTPSFGVQIAPEKPQATKQFSITEMPAKEMARFMEIYETVKRHDKLKITGIFEIVSDFVTAFRTEGKALLILAALRNADAYTFTHSTNVCILNLAQAITLGIDGQQLNDIGVAGMLHDIGKLFIPEEIITKEDKLTNEEFLLMKSHSLKGARYLLETPGAPRLAITTAFEHHLKHNLSGYPQVPAGWRQNLCSQMTTISDIFDALRTKRSYRQPMPLTDICDIIANMSGTELHPYLARNFLAIISRIMDEVEPGPPPSPTPAP